MRNVKFYLICFLIIIIPFLFDSCSSYKQGIRFENEGKYEEALTDFFDELRSNPGSVETKKAIKSTAKILIIKKIEKGDTYLQERDYKLAWPFYKSVYSIIIQLGKYQITIGSQQKFLSRYLEAKKKICDAYYSKGNIAYNKKNIRKPQIILEIVGRSIRIINRSNINSPCLNITKESG